MASARECPLTGSRLISVLLVVAWEIERDRSGKWGGGIGSPWLSNRRSASRLFGRRFLLARSDCHPDGKRCLRFRRRAGWHKRASRHLRTFEALVALSRSPSSISSLPRSLSLGGNCRSVDRRPATGVTVAWASVRECPSTAARQDRAADAEDDTVRRAALTILRVGLLAAKSGGVRIGANLPRSA